MPARKTDIKPLHRRVQWDTLEAFYEYCKKQHRSPEQQILHILEERRKEDPGVLVLSAATMKEPWREWLRKESEQQKIPEEELLGKCMTSYLEGLMSRQIRSMVGNRQPSSDGCEGAVLEDIRTVK